MEQLLLLLLFLPVLKEVEVPFLGFISLFVYCEEEVKASE